MENDMEIIKSQKNISTLECIACPKAAFIILVMFFYHIVTNCMYIAMYTIQVIVYHII